MPELIDKEEEKKLVFTKVMECANCGKKFKDLRVLNSKLRRKDPDQDLRPRFQGIDSLKYGVTACPHCGYAAAWKNFGHLTKLQQSLLRDNVSSLFVEREETDCEVYDYSTAVERYKLALLSALAMNVKLSEQAYLCLQLSWLIRGWLEEDDVLGKLDKEARKQLEADQDKFYRQAYDGLKQAAMKEEFPICGMDSSTYDYLMGVMSYKFGEYDDATRYCGRVVQERGVNTRLKDKALDLKDLIVEAKKAAGEEGE